MPEKPRIAIIGSGLAGLSTAFFLSSPTDLEDVAVPEQLDVHVFERCSRSGLDAASTDVVGRDGKKHRIDMPMRAVQGGYYAKCIRLYERLGIPLEEVPFDYSFSKFCSTKATRQRQSRPPQRRSRSEGTSSVTSFIYNGGNGLSFRPFSFPANLPFPKRSSDISTPDYALVYAYALLGLFVDRLQHLSKVIFFASSYLSLVAIATYHFCRGHLSYKSQHWVAQSTLKQFLQSYRIPTSFSTDILIPLFACVATCSLEELDNYPVAELLEYIVLTFGSKHYVVSNGVQSAVYKLLQHIPSENLHFGCQLASIKPSPSRKESIILEDRDGSSWEFDHVIFATQANQARSLLATYYKALQDTPDASVARLVRQQARMDALGKFRYTSSVVVNHYDNHGGCIPEDRVDRRILNIVIQLKRAAATAEEKLDSNKQLPADYIMATHDLSARKPQLRSARGEALLQTTNPTIHIDESKILNRQHFDRAVLTLEGKSVLKRFVEYDSESSLQGVVDGIWFVGAWAAEGIPLLEGCVSSAERVSRGIRGAISAGRRRKDDSAEH